MYSKPSIATVPAAAIILAIVALAVATMWPMVAQAAEQAEDTDQWRFMEQNSWDYQASFTGEPDEAEALSATEMQFLEENIWELSGRHAYPAGSPDNPARISVWLYDAG